MHGMTEEEYAMKFCMLIALNEELSTGLNKYAENFINVLESYSRLVRNCPRLVLTEENLPEDEELKNCAAMLEEICRTGDTELIVRQNLAMQSKLFALMVEAVYRMTILIRFYAPQGALLLTILQDFYWGNPNKKIVQICDEQHISRSTFFRRRDQAVMYGGFFFYKVVLAEMQGKI